MITNKNYTLEKFGGKGGWTYVSIPEAKPISGMPFGWVIVNGSIDGYPLKKQKLLSLGNNRLFLPVKTEIRKAMNKEVGDTVNIKLLHDKSILKIPKELLECFKNEPKKVLNQFISLSEIQQQAFIDWIFLAKTEETKVDRIIKMIDAVANKQTLHQLRLSS